MIIIRFMFSNTKFLDCSLAVPHSSMRRMLDTKQGLELYYRQALSSQFPSFRNGIIYQTIRRTKRQC